MSITEYMTPDFVVNVTQFYLSGCSNVSALSQSIECLWLELNGVRSITQYPRLFFHHKPSCENSPSRDRNSRQLSHHPTWTTYLDTFDNPVIVARHTDGSWFGDPPSILRVSSRNLWSSNLSPNMYFACDWSVQSNMHYNVALEPSLRSPRTILLPGNSTYLFCIQFRWFALLLLSMDYILSLPFGLVYLILG